MAQRLTRVNQRIELIVRKMSAIGMRGKHKAD